MGIVLADAGITYDVDSDGTSILVEAGKTSKARMILAEKGLPSSSGSGYELFDNLGSLGPGAGAGIRRAGGAGEG